METFSQKRYNVNNCNNGDFYSVFWAEDICCGKRNDDDDDDDVFNVSSVERCTGMNAGFSVMSMRQT